MARPKKQYFGEDKTSNTTSTVKKNLKALTKIAAGETVDEAVNVAETTTPKKRRTRSPNKAKGVALESVQVTIPVALTFQVGQLVGQYLTQQMQKQA